MLVRRGSITESVTSETHRSLLRAAAASRWCWKKEGKDVRFFLTSEEEDEEADDDGYHQKKKGVVMVTMTLGTYIVPRWVVSLMGSLVRN